MKSQALKLGTISLAAFLSTGCGLMQQPKLQLAGHEYRVVHASEATAGSLGYKLETDFPTSWFTTDRTKYESYSSDPLPNTEFRIDTTETQEINTDKLIALSASNPQIADLAAKWNQQKKTSGRYIVYRIEDKFKLAQEVVNNPVMLERFKEDSNFRIVTAAVVIQDHEELSSINKELKFDASEIAKLAKTNAAIELKDKSGTMVKISNGTVVGYEFARACWELNTGKLKAMAVDAEGEDGKSCPGSSIPSYKKAMNGGA